MNQKQLSIYNHILAFVIKKLTLTLFVLEHNTLSYDVQHILVKYFKIKLLNFKW